MPVAEGSGQGAQRSAAGGRIATRQDTEGPGTKASRFDSAADFLFLAYLAGSMLILTDFLDVNEPKWFLIRTVAPSLLTAVLLRDLWRGGIAAFRPGVMGAVAIGLLAWSAATSLVATNVGRSWTEVSELAGLICSFLLAARLGATALRRDRVLWLLVLVGAAVSLYGIAQHFGRDFMSWEQHAEVPVSRGVSFFGHATFAASVLIQIIPIALGLAAARGSRAARVLAAGAAGLMLYHLSFSGARMATLSAVLTAMGAMAWIGIRQWRTRRRGAARRMPLRAGAALVAGLLIATAGGGWFVARAWQAKQSDLFAIRQASLALRIFHWETASRIVFAHPLMGVGAGNYEVVSPSYWNEVEQLRTARYGRWMQQAHNEYLQTAAELGLPGVALLFVLIAYGLVMALDIADGARERRERGLALAMAASVAAIALDANITFSLQTPGSALVFWIMLGLIAGTHAGMRRAPS